MRIFSVIFFMLGFSSIASAEDKKCEPSQPVICLKAGDDARNAGDRARALRYYASACVWGLNRGCLDRADVLMSGPKPDYALAAAILAPLCNTGNVVACNMLAMAFWNNPSASNQQSAIILHQRACGLNDQKACARKIAAEFEVAGDPAVRSRKFKELEKGCAEGRKEFCETAEQIRAKAAEVQKTTPVNANLDSSRVHKQICRGEFKANPACEICADGDNQSVVYAIHGNFAGDEAEDIAFVTSGCSTYQVGHFVIAEKRGIGWFPAFSHEQLAPDLCLVIPSKTNNALVCRFEYRGHGEFSGQVVQLRAPKLAEEILYYSSNTLDDTRDVLDERFVDMKLVGTELHVKLAVTAGKLPEKYSNYEDAMTKGFELPTSVETRRFKVVEGKIIKLK